MNLELSLPAHLAEQPAFSTNVLAGVASSTQTVTTEPASGDGEEETGSTLATIFNLGILLLIPLGMYFLLIRPQRKRRNEAQALQSSIGVGDEVVTTSGVYGFVTAIEDETGIIWLEIDDDVQIRISRAAISGKVNAGAAASTSGGTDAAGDDTADASGDDSSSGGDTATGDGTATTTTRPSGRPSLKGRSKSSDDSSEATTE